MAYMYPYGDTQQLNLSWFLSEFENLKQAWEQEKAGIEGALDAEIAKAEAALADVFAARDTAVSASQTAATARTEAVNASRDASGYAVSAAGSAQNAGNSEIAARQSATLAEEAKSTAIQKADQAVQAADTAVRSAQNAGQSAANAAASETAAAGSATAAAGSATSAGDDADRAESAAENVESSLDAITANTKAIKDITRNEYYQFVKDAYIPTNGSTVNINNPTPSSTGYRYAVIDCIENDNFTLTNITSGTSPRAWCFIDASGNSLSVASAGISIDTAIITAPENAAKLVVNDQSGNGMVYKGVLLNNKVNFIEERSNIITDAYTPNEYAEREFVGANNQRKIYFRKNVIEQIGTPQTGSTSGFYILNKPLRYLGNTLTNAQNNLTDDDFSPIYIDNQSINVYFEMIYERLTEAEKNTGRIVFFTKNLETGVITSNFFGSFAAPYGAKKYYKSEFCLTAALPEIIENKNIAIVFQSTYAAINVKIKFNIAINPTNLSVTSYIGELNKSIANLEAGYIATRNYNINDIVLVGNTLLIVTQNIATGEQIILDTNATATTIGALITNILNS